jgi:AcrR family transcriptional regulator
VVAYHQRQRIIQGAAKEIAGQGYRAISVADIVRSARIARGRFYEQFASKEDCFMALYEEGTTGALAEVQTACAEVEGDFPARVEAGLAALLAYIDRNPQVARACIVEGPVVGQSITGRYEKAISSFADLLRAGRVDGEGEEGGELPATLEETVVGGIIWVVYQRLALGRPDDLEGLAGELSEFALTPYLGAEVAKRVAGER